MTWHSLELCNTKVSSMHVKQEINAGIAQLVHSLHGKLFCAHQACKHRPLKAMHILAVAI